MEVNDRPASKGKLVAMVLGTLAFFVTCLLVGMIGRGILTVLGIYGSSPNPQIRALDQWLGSGVSIVAFLISVFAANRVYRNYRASQSRP